MPSEYLLGLIMVCSLFVGYSGVKCVCVLEVHIDERSAELMRLEGDFCLCACLLLHRVNQEQMP